MSDYKIISALLSVSLLFCGVGFSQNLPIPQEIDLLWQVTPMAEPLGEQQVTLLTLYMNYPEAPEMVKLSKNIKALLALYIATHLQQLDSTVVYRFRVSEMIGAGMSLDEIGTLQFVMGNIREGRVLTQHQNEFLYKFISKHVKSDPTLCLDPLLKPLFLYVKNTPASFDSKLFEVLKNALFMSVGLGTQEIKSLNALADRRAPDPILQENEVAALNKLMLMGSLVGVDVCDPHKLTYLQGVIYHNSNRFNPQLVEKFHSAVENSPTVQHFRWENRKTDSMRNPTETQLQNFREQQRSPGQDRAYFTPQQMQQYTPKER